MEMIYEKVKGQKFDIGRTINFTKCNCEKCDFMNCPNNNYAVLTKVKKHSVSDFLILYKDDLIKLNTRNFRKDELVLNKLELTYNLINELVGECFNFPKGLFWDFGWSKDDWNHADICDSIYTNIKLVVLKRGNICTRSTIAIDNGKIYDTSIYSNHCALANRISKAFILVKKTVNEWIKEATISVPRETIKTGWLSTDGEFTPTTDYKNHNDIAREYYKTRNINKSNHFDDYDDQLIEKIGFVKISSFSKTVPLDNFFSTTKEITKKQHDWLHHNKAETLKHYMNWFYKEDN